MQTIIGKASFSRRLIAAVYDGFLLFAVLFAAAALYGWLTTDTTPLSNNQLHTGDVVHELQPIAHGWLYKAYLAAVIILFYTAFWCKTGQTLGMQAWRIKAQSCSGDIMSFKQGLLRAAVGLGLFGIAMLWMLFNKNQQTLYDKLSNTEVVLLAKPSKS